jgi:hypothetical protein
LWYENVTKEYHDYEMSLSKVGPTVSNEMEEQYLAFGKQFGGYLS